MKGHKKVLQYLIEKGAQLNVRDSSNISPLDNACYNGHYQCALLLVEAGAKVKHKRKLTSGLHHASYR
jgi:ankyrin repeat protein